MLPRVCHRLQHHRLLKGLHVHAHLCLSIANTDFSRARTDKKTSSLLSEQRENVASHCRPTISQTKLLWRLQAEAFSSFVHSDVQRYHHCVKPNLGRHPCRLCLPVRAANCRWPCKSHQAKTASPRYGWKDGGDTMPAG